MAITNSIRKIVDETIKSMDSIRRNNAYEADHQATLRGIESLLDIMAQMADNLDELNSKLDKVLQQTLDANNEESEM